MKTRARFTSKLMGAIFCLAMLLALAPAAAFAAEGDACTATADCNGTYNSNGFCSVCDGYEEPSLKDGYYQIANAGQLCWFSEKAAETPWVNAVLTADIDLNPGFTFNSDGTVTKGGAIVTEGWRSWEPIGVVGYRDGFSGTFDGTGHTVRGIYCTDESSNQQQQEERSALGLFCGIAGGTVKNVGVTNGYISGNKRLGGIVGQIHSGSVSKCWNELTIVSDTLGEDSWCGGIAGISYGVIEDCWNGGAISADGYRLGGIVGLQEDQTGAVLENCYNVGTVTKTGEKTMFGPIAGEDENSRVSNCYYLEGTSVGGNEIGTAASEGDFKSGKVAYLLNEGVTDGTQAWYQTCGEGNPAHSGKTVYAGSSKCYLGAEDTRYTNDPATIESHTYGLNGFCSNLREDGVTPCGAYQPCTKNADGAYEIGNAGQLYWFAQQVNDRGETSADAVLTADITVNEDATKAEGRRSWTPIGNRMVTGKAYGAGANASPETFTTFDGKGHAIRGLYCDQCDQGAQSLAALFGDCEGAILKNVIVEKSVFYADQLAAAIVGDVSNSQILNCHSFDNEIVVVSYSAGGVIGGCTNVTVERCSNTSSVRHMDNKDTENGYRAGGIVGFSEKSTIRDCWNGGEVCARSLAAGGIVGGDEGDLTIENCHNVGKVSLIGAGTSYSPILGMRYIRDDDTWGDLVVKNCYYLDADYPEDSIPKGAEAKDPDAFASGEVAWLLNGKTSKDTVWKQTLDDDPQPIFSGETVYFYNGEYSNKAFIENALITITGDNVYDGNPKEPDIKVVHDDMTLTEGTDYVVSYSDNVNAGSCDVTITGVGNYAGSATRTFSIAPAHLYVEYMHMDGKGNIDGVTFSGLAAGESLTIGVDFTVSVSIDLDQTPPLASGTVELNDTAKANNYALYRHTATGEIENNSVRVPVYGEIMVEEPELSTDAPETEVEIPESVATTLLGEVERQAILSGYDVRIWIAVDGLSEEEVPAKDKATIESLPVAQGAAGIKYLDISMLLQIQDGVSSAREVSNAGGKVTITITVPEDIRHAPAGYSRSFVIVAYHDHSDQVEVIDASHDAANSSLTFSAGQFSTYGIVYTDTPLPGSNDASGKGVLANTGDSSPHVPIVAAALAACALTLAARKRAKDGVKAA